MGKKSRQEDILELFYEYPTKQWHFTEVRKNVPIADNKVSRWLKLLVKEGIVKRTKLRGKMPYYTSNFENPEYQNRKRIYALERLHKSGFLNHLSSLKKPKAVILFGSFTRWDWHKDSDIDLFILGNDDEFEKGKFEQKLKREIQLFTCQNKKEMKKYNKELLLNIVKGDLIKGDMSFIEVSANA